MWSCIVRTVNGLTSPQPAFESTREHQGSFVRNRTDRIVRVP